MTDHRAEMLLALYTVDVPGIRALWHKIAPGAPQPGADAEVVATIHIARTATGMLPDKARFYSHRWCLDHGFPSKLPDRLKPSAERVYPCKVTAVGISYNGRSDLTRAVAPLINRAMADAVLEAHADGLIEDSMFVRSRLREARRNAMRRLLGRMTDA